MSGLAVTKERARKENDGQNLHSENTESKAQRETHIYGARVLSFQRETPIHIYPRPWAGYCAHTRTHTHHCTYEDRERVSVSGVTSKRRKNAKNKFGKITIDK